MTRYVLDVWALLALLQEEEPAATRMALSVAPGKSIIWD